MYYLNYIVIFSFNFSKDASPIPLTFLISSIDLNPPLDSLYDIMSAALDGPIPGKVSNSDSVALFILISPSLLLVSNTPCDITATSSSTSFLLGITIH